MLSPGVPGVSPGVPGVRPGSPPVVQTVHTSAMCAVLGMRTKHSGAAARASYGAQLYRRHYSHYLNRPKTPHTTPLTLL